MNSSAGQPSRNRSMKFSGTCLSIDLSERQTCPTSNLFKREGTGATASMDLATEYPKRASTVCKIDFLANWRVASLEFPGGGFPRGGGEGGLPWDP